MRYRVLVADPPWPFRDHLPGPARGASKHYGTMTMRDIKTFTLPPLYHNSVLFLWRVAAMQQEALDVLSAWDFELKTELVWKKRTVHNKRAFGMGHIVRAEHEVCLIATSGKPVIKSKNTRSMFEAPISRHSEKPEAFYRIVEQLADGPYVELFARRQRPGWTCLGDEL
jgi:N6-adenosine-specific RNA methylase IME4